MNPLIIAGLISLVGVIAAGLIAFLSRLTSRQNGQLMEAFRFREDAISDMLSQLRAQGQALTQATTALNALHQDMKEAMQEGREAHSEQIKALTRLLERP